MNRKTHTHFALPIAMLFIGIFIGARYNGGNPKNTVTMNIIARTPEEAAATTRAMLPALNGMGVINVAERSIKGSNE